jgi:hypothetical protein
VHEIELKPLVLENGWLSNLIARAGIAMSASSGLAVPPEAALITWV